MRLNTSSATATPAVSRTEVSTPATTLKAAPQVKPTVAKPVDDFQVGPNDTPTLPLVHITIPPFPFPGDANGRTQAKQLHEIADGVRNGSITPAEAERLMKQQANISKATDAAMADGKLSTEEKLKLTLMQAQADLSTYQAEHNSDRNLLSVFDSTAQQQASQIDQIANGRANGNVTANEASKLLKEEAGIAHDRGNKKSELGDLMLRVKMAQAGLDIAVDSRPGDQEKGGIISLPQFPPNDFPREFPLPREPKLGDLKPFRVGALGL